MMKPEAQAILLAAGAGSRLSTVGFLPKSLLPVGNYPLIYYPLLFLQNSGFLEVTVIVRSGDEREVEKVREQFGLKIKFDLSIVNASDDPGTAESIRRIQNKIKKNVEEVVIVSCDMITDFSLQPMMDSHCSKGAALTVLTAFKQPTYQKACPPGPKIKTSINNDIFCCEEGTDRLVYCISGGDYDDVVKLPNRAIEAVDSGIQLSTDLIDAHLYIMKRWLIDYIVHKNSPLSKLGSLKAEVIPHIVMDQFARKDQSDNYTMAKAIKRNRYEELIKEYNTSSLLSRFKRGSTLDERVCYSFTHPGFLVRINTMGHLWQINRQVKDLYERLKVGTTPEKPEEGVSSKAQICKETVIGRSVQIADKTNICRSVIGNHCQIESLVRVADSVLFDYVSVAKECVIENSLICVNVNFKCTIKNCILVDPTKIEENGTYKNELLEISQVYAD